MENLLTDAMDAAGAIKNPPGAAWLAEVVFPVPVRRGFDYAIPDALSPTLRPGHRVSAPFGRRGNQVGVVLRVHSEKSDLPASALKFVQEILDPEPALGEKELRLACWLSERYFCSAGQAAFAVLPIGAQHPPTRASSPRIDAAPLFQPSAADYTLTTDQRQACERIVPGVTEGAFRPFLLWGVAAAGKTEVYLHAIAAALARGKSALYLVPEIGLTPQAESILKARFGGGVEVWHSEIARGERWRIWRRARSGECRVLLGPRSAVFAPMKDLGVIVLDEEHDPSYKEDSGTRYHAREVAVEKARLHGVPVILGSATPSMESYQRALAGEFEFVEMARRVSDGPPPEVRIVDLRRAGWQLLSTPLAEAVGERLSQKEQSLLFLNRRGFATYIMCPACGWEARCPACAVSLVYHKAGRHSADDAPPEKEPALFTAALAPTAELRPNNPTKGDGPSEPGGWGRGQAAGQRPENSAEGLYCHYCAHKIPLPETCPDCKQKTVRLRGRGTQRTTSELKLWFPSARILRWDRDTTRRRGAHSRAFDAVHSESVDIIVGTQMITQGFDFPRVTLVGILDADRGLRFPDFRAGERTFQLLVQVSGRAGRADKPGVVFLQTRNPEHYAIQSATRLDYKAFAEEELKFRREMGYPPYARLIQIVLRGRSGERVEKAAEELLRWLESAGLPEELQCLGPAPSFHPLQAGHARWQVLIKGPDALIERAFKPLLGYKPPKTVSISVDVDPEELS